MVYAILVMYRISCITHKNLLRLAPAISYILSASDREEYEHMQTCQAFKRMRNGHAMVLPFISSHRPSPVISRRYYFYIGPY